MEPKLIQKIFTDTAYIRTGGSPEELKAAEYIRDICATFGATATIEEFDVQMATMHTDTLTVDGLTASGLEIPCKGYLTAGSHGVEAPLC